VLKLFLVTIEWQKMDLQIHNLLALKIIRNLKEGEKKAS